MSIEIKSDILAKELNQGIVPLGVPKAYQYDAALVEAARAAVNQGLDDVADELCKKYSSPGNPCCSLKFIHSVHSAAHGVKYRNC